MPTKPEPQFAAWSYSRLKDWENCPLKAKLKHLDKIPEPGSETMKNGNRVHKIAEGYSTGKLPAELPTELANFADEFAMLRKRSKSLAVEQQIAMTAKWEPTDWFAKSAWVRVILDCWYQESPAVDIVIDYKTGKVRAENDSQLSLYALARFQTSTKATRVSTALWYLDAGEISAREFTRTQVPVLKKQWEKRSLPMLNDRTFKPTPNRLCGWCHYARAKDAIVGRTESVCPY